MSLTREQREALLQQSLYTEGIDDKRILAGFGADATQALFGRAAEMVEFSADPGERSRYRELRRGLDPERAKRREAAVEAAALEASRRQAELVRQLPSKVDPTKAAGLIQRLEGSETQAQKARLDAQTQADKAEAEENLQRTEELSRLEKAAGERKKGRRMANLKAIGTIVGAGFKGLAARKPKTYERKLEDRARRQEGREEKLAQKERETFAKGIDLAAEGKTGRAERKMGRSFEIEERRKKKEAQFGETTKQLADLRAAEATKQRERLALLRQSSPYAFGTYMADTVGGVKPFEPEAVKREAGYGQNKFDLKYRG